MPSQQVETAEAIINLRKALRREKEAPSNRPIYSTTNRGNKLQKGASFVNTGKLAYTQGGPPTKQKIEHAGYTRYILERNPRRYNEYGDELEDSESDEGADADAADDNPYSDIRLEELLCPLKYPAELVIHPTLSVPYLDSALPNMVKTTEEKLRQERANLWRAKNINRQLLGDEVWMPCERVESIEDWDMFEPRRQQVNGMGRKQMRPEAGEPSGGVQNGSLLQDHVPSVEVTNPLGNSISPSSGHHEVQADIELPDVYETTTEPQAKERSGSIEPTDQQQSNDAVMEDAQPEPQANGAISAPPGQHRKEEQTTTDEINEGKTPVDSNPPDITDEDKLDEQRDNSSPPPPTRRITRALAANNDNSNAPTPPLSPTPTLTTSSTSSLLQVDPLFLVPDSLRTATRMAALYNLPADEALETRRLLTAFIQKQEESVRGYEALLAKLIKAQRMRDEVWEMCKADGHVGEISDGEDWIDYEQWKLQPGDLRKGKYEEEDAMEETGIGGRKGKRRRNQ